MTTLEESRAWVANLDRSELGSFAMDADQLARYHQSRYNKLDDKLHPIYLVGDNTDFIAEFLVWQQKEKGGTPVIGDHRVRSRFKMLKTILAHPEYLHYFEAGMFDTEAIKQYIAADIDPMMARVL